MQQRTLRAELAQPYVRLGTLRRMSEVAAKLASARKAVSEIRGIEDQLMASGTTTDGLRDAMSDTVAYAKVASKSTAEAIGMLKGMKPAIEAYLSEVRRDAAG